MKKLKLIYNNKYSINNLNNESFIAKFVSINTRINKNYLICLLKDLLVKQKRILPNIPLRQ